MTTPTPTNEQVASFLRNNEDFFQQRPDLLELLRLPDPSGAAVSLLERQAQVLRERNDELRERLHNLLDIARENDRLFEKTRRLVLDLMEPASLDGLLDALINGLKREFAPDSISLLLYQPHPLKTSLEKHVRCLPASELHEALQMMLSSNRAVCGVLRPAELQQLFPDSHASIGSAAMVPLLRHQPLGLLAIGSKHPEHFKSSLGTLFVSHIGEVLARRIASIQPISGSTARRA